MERFFCEAGASAGAARRFPGGRKPGVNDMGGTGGVSDMGGMSNMGSMSGIAIWEA